MKMSEVPNGAFQGLNEDERGSQWSFSRVK